MKITKKEFISIAGLCLCVFLLGFVYRSFFIGSVFDQFYVRNTGIQNANIQNTNVKHVFDLAKVLSADYLSKFEQELQAMQLHYDVNIVFYVVPTLNGKDIVYTASQLAQSLNIGRGTKGDKGILFLIVTKEQKIKIEIGYDLEEAFPDFYVFQVESEMLKEFLEQGNWELAFTASTEHLLERIIRLSKKHSLDVSDISSSGNGNNQSGGAGVVDVFNFGSLQQNPYPKASPDIKRYFGAQATAQDAFKKYLEFNARNATDYDVELFTDASRVFYKNWKTTSAQRRSEYEQLSGVPFNALTKDNWAVIIFEPESKSEKADYPIYFLKKSTKGWQMDIDTMSRDLTVGAGLSVHLIGTSNPYIHILQDYFEYSFLMGLVPKSEAAKVGYTGVYFLGNGLYDPDELGIHIAVSDTEEAKNTGLQTGDSIIQINGQTATEEMIVQLANGTQPDTRYNLKLLRDGREIKHSFVTQNMPDGFKKFKETLKESHRPWFGVYYGSRTIEYEEKILNLPPPTYTECCAVLEVCDGSPAEKAGIKQGDIIFSLNGTRQDIGNFIKERKPSETIEVKVLRNLSKKLTFSLVVEETSHYGCF